MNDILSNVMPLYSVCTYVIIILFTSARNIPFARQNVLLGKEKVVVAGTWNVFQADLTQELTKTMSIM